MISALKITAADDYRTWVAAFTCLVVPFEKKIEYRKNALESLIKEYKNKNLDAYGMYSYDATTLEYKFTSGDVAEKYFYFAVGMDNESYESLDAYLLNKYIEKEIVKK